MKKKVFLSSDGQGTLLRLKILNRYASISMVFEDLGMQRTSKMDFTDISKQLALKIEASDSFGIIICQNAFGVAIALNKFKGLRAAFCRSKEEATNVRRELDANVLCLSCDQASFENAEHCIEAFLKTSFEAGKYEDSIFKLDTIATKHVSEGINLIVRGVILHKNHLLLSTTTKSNKEYATDLYFLPGGHVDYRESAIEALKRELFEEMLLKVDSVAFIGGLECCWNKKDSVYHELNLLYNVEAEDLSLQSPPKSTDSFIEFVWKPISQLFSYKILPQELLPMLQEALATDRRGLFYSQMSY